MKPIQRIKKLLNITKKSVVSAHCKKKKAWPADLYNYYLDAKGRPQCQFFCECGCIYFKGKAVGGVEYYFGALAVLNFLKLQFRIISDPNMADGINKIHKMLTGKPQFTKKELESEKRHVALLIKYYSLLK